MTLYLDSSAIVKLVAAEAESGALHRYLRANAGARATSSIARVEVLRAAALLGVAAVTQARAVLTGIDEIAVDRALLDRAAVLPVNVRTLDAIHLASAERARTSLTAVITYDRRMAVAADALGLPVAAPG